jgi:hypothetical protein
VRISGSASTVWISNADGTSLEVIYSGERTTNEPKPGEVDGCAVALSSHELYICDDCYHRVQVFDFKGKFRRMWGSKGEAYGQFRHPTAITTVAGLVVVADSSRIQAFREDGEFVWQVKSPEFFCVFWLGSLEDTVVLSTGEKLFVYATDGTFLRCRDNAWFSPQCCVGGTGELFARWDNHELIATPPDFKHMRTVESTDALELRDIFEMLQEPLRVTPRQAHFSLGYSRKNLFVTSWYTGPRYMF